MNYVEEDYELKDDNTDNDLVDILSDIPLTLTLENIKSQIEDPSSSPVDHLTPVVEKAAKSIKDYKEDTEITTQIRNVLEKFCNDILDAISAKYNIYADVRDNSLGETIKFTMCLYSIIVLKYSKFITKFLYKYIFENRTELVSVFGDVSKSKDVTSSALKKIPDNAEDKDLLVAIANVTTILDNITDNSSSIDPLEFLRLCKAEQLYYGAMLIDLIQMGRVSGNFVPAYVNIANECEQDIVIDVKINLTTKYRKRRER